MSCSPSARARTVTAHSLKAIGMKRNGRGNEELLVRNGVDCRAINAAGPLKIRNPGENPKSPANRRFFWRPGVYNAQMLADGPVNDLVAPTGASRRVQASPDQAGR